MKTAMSLAVLVGLSACSSSSNVSTWVALDGSEPQEAVLAAAYSECEFNEQAQLSRAYRDAAQQALELDNMQLRSVYMDNANEAATAALTCMRDKGLVVVNQSTPDDDELNLLENLDQRGQTQILPAVLLANE